MYGWTLYAICWVFLYFKAFLTLVLLGNAKQNPTQFVGANVRKANKMSDNPWANDLKKTSAT
jgi:hypothetical protein